jgi:outer membrane protein assembly factor BamB
MDRGGIISCFDSQTGELVWNTSIGDEEYSHKITVSETRVYVAFQRGKISCLDKNNGTLLWVINKFLYNYVWPIVSVDGIC